VSNPAKTNQDTFVALEIDNGTHLFAVADGHGSHGHIVSQLAARRLTEFFRDNSSRGKAH
jgi:serine/threonine protein phosphatase PrpC